MEILEVGWVAGELAAVAFTYKSELSQQKRRDKQLLESNRERHRQARERHRGSFVPLYEHKRAAGLTHTEAIHAAGEELHIVRSTAFKWAADFGLRSQQRRKKPVRGRTRRT